MISRVSRLVLAHKMHSFSFLVTTDNHMGYKEDDHLRREDSYRAFEEALQIGRTNDVDFILLGGDLFHVNRPSASVEHRCIKIIRAHMNALADRPISFRRVQGSFSHISTISHANFEDPNLTVPYPIFTIHGNHDDPTGPNAQSVCKKLATCGLLNYFGDTSSKTSQIVVEPIVIEKSNIKIAIYGMGFMPDLKLRTAFQQGLVKFIEPPKDTFNILVVHQNRIPLNKNKFIPDDFYPKFIHLLIRGHEHAAQMPELIPDSSVEGLVYQPGSTVATSISLLESEPKKVGLFSVSIKDELASSSSGRFKLDYRIVSLETSRPMILKDVMKKDVISYVKERSSLMKLPASVYQKYALEYVVENIDRVLRDHQMKMKEFGDVPLESKSDSLPLVRLRLEYISKDERFDELDVVKEFYPNRVANKDIILFKKQKISKNEDGQERNDTFSEESSQDPYEDIECIDLEEQKKDTIDVMIEKYFVDKPADERLQVLSIDEYTNAVRGSSEDGNVISKVLAKKKQEILEKFAKALKDEEVAERDFHDEDKVKEWFIGNMKNKQ